MNSNGWIVTVNSKFHFLSPKRGEWIVELKILVFGADYVRRNMAKCNKAWPNQSKAWHNEESSFFFWKNFKMTLVRSNIFCHEHGITFWILKQSWSSSTHWSFWLKCISDKWEFRQIRDILKQFQIFSNTIFWSILAFVQASQIGESIFGQVISIFFIMSKPILWVRIGLVVRIFCNRDLRGLFII